MMVKQIIFTDGECTTEFLEYRIREEGVTTVLIKVTPKTIDDGGVRDEVTGSCYVKGVRLAECQWDPFPLSLTLKKPLDPTEDLRHIKYIIGLFNRMNSR